MMNGTQQPKVQFKKRSLTHEQQPDAPEGKWTVTVPKGKSKPVTTAAEKGGDPGILFQLKITKADDEKNESFQGSHLPLRLYFYDGGDPEKRKQANMNLRTATSLAEACELDLKDIYPDELDGEEDLWKIIEKVEGKTFDVWTTHRTSEFNGEKMINVDIRFREPGSGLATKPSDDEDDERPGKKPAAKGSKRR